MPSLHVVALAGTALYQDAGRHHVDSGVPISGAFDRYAHESGNGLLGGSAVEASLEIVGMIELAADVPVTCAVTGSAAVSVDGGLVAHWMAFDLAAGARVRVTAQGRGYLAVAGGFQPGAVLGSRSTCLMGPLGPPPVGLGDALPLSAAPTSATAGDYLRPPERPTTIHATPGPHLELAGGEVRVLESSRIGVRLTSGRIVNPGPGSAVRQDLPSMGVLPGTIQMLPSGDWMLLGPDAGTMGGYPVVGVVSSADLDAVAHLRAGDRMVLAPGDRLPPPRRPGIVRVRGLGA